MRISSPVTGTGVIQHQCLTQLKIHSATKHGVSTRFHAQ